MPNAIKYSTSAQTLALKKGNFWIGTGDVGKGPTSSTDYYNGITPPSGGYTIYLNRVSGGPSIYTVSTEAQLTGLTTSIAGQTLTTSGACLNWFATQTDKMIFNIDYPAIVTNGLILNLDAGFTPSYSRSGTTWYDLSGSNNGTLTNGPTFSSTNAGSIVFDGVDDYVSMNNLGFALMGSGISSTVCLWTKLNTISTSQNMVILEQSNTSAKRYVIWFQTADKTLNFYPNNTNHKTSTISDNTWYFISTIVNGSTSRMFLNGVEVGSSTSYTPQDTNSTFWLGIGPVYSSEDWNGNLSNIQVYNRALSASEILQNYNAQKGRFGL
jgi:hypothetical protein